VLYGIAAVLPYMKLQKAGHIINVSSVAGHKVGPGLAVYAATKHAVRALSEGLRQEVKPYNIRTTVTSGVESSSGLVLLRGDTHRSGNHASMRWQFGLVLFGDRQDRRSTYSGRSCGSAYR
jgi:NADP-dependent 3-hydroxy acid dehydrogenase YdfG